ncbi:MAG: Holliday junction branch migration protein RuvA [Firmicutes bacterium HGW-Firmicutes-13]|nr:MAG: Holliday junction branch migration protein RuvA [Firmicutes bacterium HGW-Firmicutes-13]
MFAYICGTLVYSGNEYLILDNRGIGYKIFMPPGYQTSLPLRGEEIKIYTYLYIREEQVLLYGFLQSDDVALFELLLSVSGIGPKGAVSIIGFISAARFFQAVVNEDVKSLVEIPGIGSKTAKRIILELKEKITALKGYLEDLIDTGNEPDTYKEVEEALTSLGYSTKESWQALDQIKSRGYSGKSQEDILRLALNYLAGQ